MRSIDPYSAKGKTKVCVQPEGHGRNAVCLLNRCSDCEDCRRTHLIQFHRSACQFGYRIRHAGRYAFVAVLQGNPIASPEFRTSAVLGFRPPQRGLHGQGFVPDGSSVLNPQQTLTGTHLDSEPTPSHLDRCLFDKRTSAELDSRMECA